MPYNFVAPERDQLYLLPPSLSEWLPEDHLAWFVLDCVEEMDLSVFYTDYRKDGWGGAAHHPKTMVALLVYAYCLGVRSSRQIERACHVDVGFRVICAGLFPDHTTFARFRQRHEAALKSIFTASLRLCATAGMTSVGIVALDGTKMAANAAMSANRTKQTIDDTVAEMFAEAKAADAAEDAQFGDARGDEPPAVLRGRADRKRRFKAAKELLDRELEEEQAAHEAHLAERAAKEEERGKKLQGRKPKAPKDKAGAKEKKVNPTDPCSKIMSTSKGFIQGYNAQAVANEDQVIVAAEVTDEQNDMGQLHPMIETAKTSLTEAGIDERPDKLWADAGYCSEENLAALGDEDPDVYVATRNMKKNQTPRTGRRGPLKQGATLVDTMDRKVVLPPGAAHVTKAEDSPALGAARELLEHRGSASRLYRNMVVFLAADHRRIDDLRQGMAEALAWGSIAAESEQLGLARQESVHAATKAEEAEGTVERRLAEAYVWALVPTQPEPTGPIVLTPVRIEGEGTLAARTARRLIDKGHLSVVYAPSVLRTLVLGGPLAPLWESGHVSVAELWDALARYPYLPRLRDRRVLERAVGGGPTGFAWAEEGFALAEGYDPRSGRYLGLAVGPAGSSTVSPSTLLVRPEVALVQVREDERAASRAAATATTGLAPSGASAPTSAAAPHAAGPPRPRRFHGSVVLRSDRLIREFSQVVNEVVQHLADSGAAIEVTVEISATKEEGFDEAAIRTVTENAGTLHVSNQGFEEE